MHRHHHTPSPLSFPLPSIPVNPLPLLDEEFDADAIEALGACESSELHVTPEISWEDIEDNALAA